MEIMSWRDRIESIPKETEKVSSWKDRIEDIKTEAPKAEQEGFFEQIATGITSPFSEAKEQKHSPKAMADAKEYLKSTGYDPDSAMASISTALQGLTDVATFGQREEATALLESVFSDKSYEELRDMYEAVGAIRREQSPIASTVGEVAGYVSSPAALAKAGAKKTIAPILAGQAVGLGVSRAEEGKEAESAARTLTEEAITLGAFKAVSKAYNAVRGKKGPAADKAAYKAIATHIDDTGGTSEQADAVFKKFKQERATLDDQIKKVEDLSESQLEHFKTHALAGVPIESYKYKDLDQALVDYKDYLAQRKATFEEAGAAGGSSTVRWLSDAQYVGNAADRKLGSSFMSTINQLSEDSVRTGNRQLELKETAQKVFDDLNIADADEGKRIIDEVESGKLTEKSAKLKDFYENLRQQINQDFGSDVIQKRKNYIPHYTLDLTDAAAKLRVGVSKAIGRNYKNVTLDDAKEIFSKPEHAELKDALRYIGGFTGKKAQALSPEGLLDTMRKTLSLKKTARVDEDLHGLDLDASSVKARLEEDIPSLIREYDPIKLTRKYIDSLVKDAHMRGTLRKLRLQAEAVRETDSETAQYMDRLLADITGGPKTKLSALTQEASRNWKTNAAEKMLEAKTPAAKKFYEIQYKAPEILQAAQSRLYPFYLGMRADNVVRNLTQPYFMTIPEIGGSAAYKAKLIGKALPETVMGLGKRKGADIEELKQGGWLPSDPTPGVFHTLREGLKADKGLKRMSKEGLEKAEKMAMYMYTQSDIANRLVTLRVGKTLVADILEGQKDALKYVSRMPPAYRRKTIQAINEGNAEEVKQNVMSHLIATTQFNYTRASMSEYGRSMGGMFSMFSKWPTAIGAELADNYSVGQLARAKKQMRLDEGNAKTLRKYLLPLMALQAADHMMGRPEEKEPRLEAAVGSKFTGYSPLSSLPASPSKFDSMFK
jgi:hypothetical protein